MAGRLRGSERARADSGDRVREALAPIPAERQAIRIKRSADRCSGLGGEHQSGVADVFQEDRWNLLFLDRAMMVETSRALGSVSVETP